LWCRKVGEFFPFFGNFVQIKVKKPSKNNNLNGDPKAF
jgi:hypothetical protein